MFCFDRSADAAAVLVLARARASVAARRSCVASNLSLRLNSNAEPWKWFDARLGDDVDDAAGGAPGLGGVVVGLDLDLGDRVDRRLDANRADRALVVVHAVDQLVVLVVERAVDGDRRRLAAIVRARAARQRVRHAFVWRPATSWTRRTKLRPFTGRSCTAFSVDERLQRRRVGLQQRRLGGHGNVLGDRPDLQFGVEARRDRRPPGRHWSIGS